MRLKGVIVGIVGIVLALALGAGGLYAYDTARADVIAEGIRIASVDVGGLTTTAARARLQEDLLGRIDRPVTVVHGKRRFVLDTVESAVSADLDGMIAEAVDVSRRGTIAGRLYRDLTGKTLRTSIPLRAQWSEAAVDALVRRVERAVERKPRDARVRPSLTKLLVVEGKKGLAVRRRALRRAVERQFLRPAASHVVEVPLRVVDPEVRTRDLKKKYPYYITISRGERRLRLFAKLKLRKVYTVAVGSIAYSTPSGTYAIQNKQVNPYWHVPTSPWTGSLAGAIIPPGPSNPLKARWMGFYNGAGIHGTDAIYSLGTAASHGCIRMSIPDVIELYDIVPVGTPIYIA